MKQAIWLGTFCALLAAPTLAWLAVAFLVCRRCGHRFRRRGDLCYTCWRRLHG